MARLYVVWCYVRVLFPTWGERYLVFCLLDYSLTEGINAQLLPVWSWSAWMGTDTAC